MKIFIDTANIDQIREVHSWGILAGCTTNPSLIAPAMNPEMWAHPAIRRHVETLQSDGWNLVGPCSGVTACGEDGLGRMVEPQDIVAAVQSALEA